MRIIISLCCLFFLASCQKTAFFYANLGNKPNQYKVEKNLSYGEEPWQKLDIYRPYRSEAKAHPVVVFYYGGSWSTGKKEYYAFVANRLIREGFMVVIPDYAKYPDHSYPRFVEDAALVTKWLSQNLSRYQGDVKQVHLLGHSAGAYNAVMLVANKSFLAKYGLSPDFYRSVTGMAGPYHFTPEAKRYQEIFGPPSRYPEIKTTRYIDGSEPRMFLISGGKDELVASSNKEALIKSLAKNHVPFQTKSYPTLGHITLIGSFSKTLKGDADVATDVVTFMKARSGS